MTAFPSSEPTPSEPTPRPARGEHLLALLACLPTAVCLWPGLWSPLAGDPAPELSASAWALLAVLPAAFVSLLRRPTRAPRGFALWLVPVAAAVLWALGAHAYDTLEADRALFGFAVSTALLLAGASLGREGRRTLALGLCSLTVLATVTGLFDPAHAGPLGNTGDLAECALIGAACGAVLATRSGAARVERVLGTAAVAGFLVWDLGVPSILAALAFGATLLVTAVVARDATALGRGARAALGLGTLALLPAVVSRATPPPTASDTPDVTRAAAFEPGDTGGIEVRRRVWSSTLALIGDHAWLGVGPGQFARAFPPYRDPAEIELSTLGRRLAGETEVEHPHADLLLAPAELGLVAGLAFALFLATVLVAAWRRMRRAERHPAPGSNDPRAPDASVALGAAAVAVIAAAGAGGPLLDNPAAACAAFAVFGALLGDWGHLIVTFAVLLFETSQARRVVDHGRAMTDLAALLAPGVPLDQHRAQRAVDAALAARPDSVAALSWVRGWPKSAARPATSASSRSGVRCSRCARSASRR